MPIMRINQRNKDTRHPRRDGLFQNSEHEKHTMLEGQIRTYIRSLTEVSPDTIEPRAYWLIECGFPATYFRRNGDWCSNPNHARRFRSQAEALEKSNTLRTMEPIRVVEHSWS